MWGVAVIAAFIVAILNQPAPVDRVVLLPQSDGKPSAVIVKSATSEIELNTPYQSAESSAGKVETKMLDKEEVERRYGDLGALQPPAPRSTALYFELGKLVLTAESARMLEKVKEDIRSFAAPEVLVIGHTDTVGSDEENDKLSSQRAGMIANELVATGVPKEQIEVQGRGKRELLVPTADNVAEPKNRRVEIKIR